MSEVNILIIEDNSIQAMYIKQVLKNIEGVNIVGIAADSDKAFELAAENKIHIIVSDINIEGQKDGIEVSQAIQHEQGSQIIFLTAFKDQATLIKASNIEFSGYLLKPFRADDLLVLINLIINKYHLNVSDNLIRINDFHSYDKEKGILYLNEKEMYLTKNENKIFKTLFNAINMPISYNSFDIEDSKRKSITSNLNIKLKGLIVRDVKEEESLLLTFK